MNILELYKSEATVGTLFRWAVNIVGLSGFFFCVLFFSSWLDSLSHRNAMAILCTICFIFGFILRGSGK